MKQDKSRRPASQLLDVGRWGVVLFLLVNQAVALQLLANDTLMPPQAVLAQVVETAACICLLWNPPLGLVLGAVPLGMSLAWGPLNADGTITVLAAVVVGFRCRPWKVAVLAALQVGYGLVRGYFWGSVSDTAVGFLFTFVLATAAGLLLRRLGGLLRRGEKQLEVLAQEEADIRAGERVRLAGELRLLVSDRLGKAWAGHRLSIGGGAAEKRASIGAVRVACLDAVTQVRALVGMLREDPVADGSDESLAAPKASAVMGRVASQLQAQGIPVELHVASELDAANLVTQLTVTRLVEWIADTGAALHPERIRLSAEASPGGARVEAELVRAAEFRAGERGVLERLAERVQALGGSLRVHSSSGHYRLVLELSDETAELPGSVTGWRPWVKQVLDWVPPLVLVALAAITGLRQNFDWPLLWAALAYVSVLLMNWRPYVGALPAIASIIGMIHTPEDTPLAVVVVVFSGTWHATRVRNRIWVIWMAFAALVGMLTVSYLGSPWSLELSLALATLCFGLLLSLALRQYLSARTVQADQAEELLAAVDRARVEERNLLARELHDVLAHHLSVILLQCMAYGESQDEAELDMVLERIAKALKSSEDELALLTSVMSEGHGSAELALVRPTTIAEHLVGTLEAEQFEVAVSIDPEADQLPAITQRTLTRVMQEGVTNILRYAKRRGRCSLELSLSQQEVKLRVVSELPPSRRGSQLSLGVGLTGIRERVDLSGGWFHAGPEAGEWVVEIRLPRGDNEAEYVGGVSAYTRSA